MKLLIDGRCLMHTRITGVQRYTASLVSAIGRLGEPFDVAKPSSTRRCSQQLWEHLKLPRLSRDYDVLFCPANIAPIKLPRSTRLIVTLHCLRYLRYPRSYHWTFRRYYRFLIRRVVARADAIITVSQAMEREILDEFAAAAGKTHVVPLGVDQAFRPGADAGADEYVLFVGNSSPAKNLSGLLEALSQIGGRTGCRLVIVGSETDPSRLPRASRKWLGRMGGRVECLGQINDSSRLAHIYQNAALLVFPSMYESFALPPLEAMACGTPVVASDIPAHREHYRDAAILVDPYDADAIGAAMLTLLTDANLRADLRRKGLERARRFSWDRCAAETMKVLSNCGSSLG